MIVRFEADACIGTLPLPQTDSEDNTTTQCDDLSSLYPTSSLPTMSGIDADIIRVGHLVPQRKHYRDHETN